MAYNPHLTEHGKYGIIPQKEARMNGYLNDHLRKAYPEEYAIFQGIRRRTSQNWPNYEHIQCEFATFAEFFDAIGPRPFPDASVDRIDVHGSYSATNIRWACSVTQAQNRRISIEVGRNGYSRPEGSRKNLQDKIKVLGTTETLESWLEITGMTEELYRHLEKRQRPQKIILTALKG